MTQSSLPSGVAANRRGRVHHHVLRDVSALRVDQMDEVAHLRRHVEGFAVLAEEHAFGLSAGRDLVHDDVLVDVDDGEGRAFFVGDIDPPAFFVQGKGLGTRPGSELADHFELGNVDDVDDVVVATGNVELAMIGIEMHVARTARDLDVLDHLIGLGIDHDQIVGLLVADEDQAGVLGMGLTRGEGRHNQSQGKRQNPCSHNLHDKTITLMRTSESGH